MTPLRNDCQSCASARHTVPPPRDAWLFCLLMSPMHTVLDVSPMAHLAWSCVSSHVVPPKVRLVTSRTWRFIYL